MPKTNFIDNLPPSQRGTRVTAAFMNSLFAANGGHKHDGLDDDGHASRIDLSTDVTGLLDIDKVYAASSFWLDFGNGFESTMGLCCIVMQTSAFSAPGLGEVVPICTKTNLYVAGGTAISDGPEFYTAAGAVPAKYRPNSTKAFPIVAIDNSMPTPAAAFFYSNGMVEILRYNTDDNTYLSIPEWSHGTQVSKGVYDFDVSYMSVVMSE